MKDFIRLQELLKQRNIEYKTDLYFRDISHIRIGGAIKLLVYPKSEGEMLAALGYCDTLGLQYRVLGRLSNVLPPEGEDLRVTVKTDRLSHSELSFDGAFVHSGVYLPMLARAASEMGLSGLEPLCGIPASIGGSTVMNAGAFGREICELIESVTVIDRSGRIYSLGAMELGFSYRHSEIKALGLTVLGVKLKLFESTKEAVLSKMRRISRQRRDTQPTDMPSLGSVFKRTDGQSAARLIDLAGLKGTRIGGASVSEKHAGFIVNLGGATPQDFKRLVRLIKDEIYKKFGIHLSEEIEYL